MRTVIFNIFFTALIFITNNMSLYAEDLDAEGLPPSLGNIPVDGGLSLLLAAGAAYGVRRVCRKKNG